MIKQSGVAVLPLAAVSAVALGLEVFESRLVAYSVQVIVLYAVLGIALLGFGAAGSLVAVRRRWLEEETLPSALAWSALAFSAAIVVAHAAFVRLTPLMTHVGVVSLALSGLLSLPFLAAGTVITLALSAGPRVGAAYAANLIGSGAGCFLPLGLLGPLDGERFLAVLALLAWVAAMFYVRAVPAADGKLRIATAATLALAVTSVALPHGVFPIQPEPEPLGQLAWQYRYAREHGVRIVKKYDRWNPTGRIEIIQLENVPGGPSPYHAMFYAQDSTAGSSLFSWDGRTKSEVRPTAESPGTFVSRLCTETLYGQGYFVPRSRVLVIGLGGGPDLQCALYQEAEHVDVVEINRDSIAAIRGPLSSWVGGIGNNPRVHMHEQDGRSFVHGRDGQYDMIQMSGVDTKNLMASGALALSENHLYTLEAFRDYLRDLRPGGALSILRFGEPEAIRLANTAVRALEDLGVPHPESHIALFHTGFLIGMVVRKDPWTPEDARALDQQLHPPYFRGASVFYYSQNSVPLETPTAVDYLPYVGAQGTAASFFDASVRGRLADFKKDVPFDIAPSPDDRPFFFDLFRYDLPATWHLPHVTALRDLLASIACLSLLFVWLPVRGFRQRAQGIARLTTPLFFACLGFGFLVTEVWLLHRFSTYLGHQVYSLSIVLSTLLVATGVGATVGARFGLDPRRRAAYGAGLAVILLLVFAAGLPHLLEATWSSSLGVRAAIAMVFVVMLGLALGQPFVAGLSYVGQRFPDAVPWCIGVNGFASVLGSVAVVPLSMATGYHGVLVAALVLYGAAGACSLGLPVER